MTITGSTLVADIATESPATIKVFQRHRIDFCCGGKVPLDEACRRKALDAPAVIAELDAALLGGEATADWTEVPLTDLVAHIRRRFHRPLVVELPRLAAMLDKVVSRHGARLPQTLLPLRDVFATLHAKLIEHMAKEDAVLFPAILSLEAQPSAISPVARWIGQPVEAMEAEHAETGAALERIARLTGGYVPPVDACPTFRGLYHGLAELDREMRLHVHIENHILFPKAAALVRDRARL